jgi:drug/metabolite transporter (DMT)-like permease
VAAPPAASCLRALAGLALLVGDGLLELGNGCAQLGLGAEPLVLHAHQFRVDGRGAAAVAFVVVVVAAAAAAAAAAVIHRLRSSFSFSSFTAGCGACADVPAILLAPPPAPPLSVALLLAQQACGCLFAARRHLLAVRAR